MNGVFPNGEIRRPELDSPGMRWVTFIVILALHVLVIGGLMWGCTSVDKPKEKSTERHYKVNLSSGPSAPLPPAPPEPRVNPHPAPPTPVPPAPPEPKVKPQPPKPIPPQPKVKPPKVKPKPKPQKVKPKQKPQKAKPKPTPPQPKVKPKPAPPQPKVKPRPTKQPPRDNDVYRPTEGQKFDPKQKYSYDNKNNRSSTSSSRFSNESARPGPPADSRANEKWQESVAGELYNNWVPPEGVFWRGQPPVAIVELKVAADGRVVSSRIVKPSGNARMDASIRQMLSVLTRVTPPPDGGQSIRVQLIPE
jgi:TonB family protein